MQYFFVVYYRFNFNITSFQISSRWWSAPAHSARFWGLLTMVKKKALSMRIPLFALFLCCIMNQFGKKHLSYLTHHWEFICFSFQSADIFCHVFHEFVYSFEKGDWTHSLRHNTCLWKQHIRFDSIFTLFIVSAFKKSMLQVFINEDRLVL